MHVFKCCPNLCISANSRITQLVRGKEFHANVTAAEKARRAVVLTAIGVARGAVDASASPRAKKFFWPNLGGKF